MLGRRYDCDEFLFKVNDLEFRFAVVHLTFSGKEERGGYPRTKVYRDIDDWINRCMMLDHSDFI